MARALKSLEGREFELSALVFDVNLHQFGEPFFDSSGGGAFVLGAPIRTFVRSFGQSIGFFVNPDTATLWRGGMATSALKQLIADADWGDLDYFILDTPPGTSDIHLTLLQTLSITGAVIVSTPQKVALADARKGIDMYRNDKVNVPILGLVENMAYFTPAELPNNKYYIFGKDGAKNLADELGVALLAQIPIVQSICESGDAGEPAATKVDTITGQAFLSLAQSVITVVNRRNKEQAPTKIVTIKE